MPTEQETLQLTVSLVDNASAGIAALRTNIQSLTSGQTAASMEKFRRSQSDMSEQIKKMTELAVGGQKAWLGYIGGFGAAGVAMAGLATVAGAGISKLKAYAEHVEQISVKAKLLGASGAELNALSKQFEAVGLSFEDAAAAVGGLHEALADMSRPGSTRFNDLVSHARQFSDAMIKGKLAIEGQTTDAGRLMEIQQQARNVERYAYEETLKRTNNRKLAEIESFDRQKQFLRFYGQTEALMSADLRQMTNEEKKRWDVAEKNSTEFMKKWRAFGDEMGGIWNEHLIAPMSTLSNTLDKLLGTVKAVHAEMNAAAEVDKQLQGKYGDQSLADRLNPFSPRNIEREQKLMPGLHQGPRGPMLPQYMPGVPQLQHGGIVSGPTLAMLGEGGPEAVVPLGQIGKQGDKARLLEDNTKELKELNDNLFGLLHPTGSDRGGGLGGGGFGRGGLGGFHGGAGGGGAGGGGGGGGGTGPNGSDVGPGSGKGAGQNTPGLPSGAGPGASLASVAAGGKFFDPFTGKVSSGALGGVDQGIGSLKSHGVLGAEGLGGAGAWGGPPGAGGGAAAAGGGGGGLNKEAYEKTFAGTPLAGKYDQVVAAANANNVPPATMAAILAHETGHGTSRMLRERNNPAGLMDPKTGMKTGQTFASVDEGIAAAGRTIGRHYKAAGGDIGKMGQAYAPVGAANDPGSLNAGWPAGVRKYQSQLGGGGNAGAAAVAGGPPPGGPPGGGRFNYYQRQGLQPGQVPLSAIDTPYGRTRVSSEAAEDFKGFFEDVHKAGAPIDSLTSGPVVRQKRGGGGWSSHAYGAAIDINDARYFTPKMQQWVKEHPQEWKQALEQHHMRWGHDIMLKGGPDDPHIEWSGPGPHPKKEATDASAAATDRATVDRHSTRTQKIEATGKLTANINAPKGTDVTAEGGGVFKKIEVNRQVQMAKAKPAAMNEQSSHGTLQ